MRIFCCGVEILITSLSILQKDPQLALTAKSAAKFLSAENCGKINLEEFTANFSPLKIWMMKLNAVL